MTKKRTDQRLTGRRRQAAKRFYEALGSSPSAARRVGWESVGAHRLRHAALIEAIGPLATLQTLIDVGCGEGALLPTLRRAGFSGRYLGEDILPAMVTAAKRQHAADPDATFTVRDSATGGAPVADAVVCSGAFNTACGADHDAFVRDAISALWARAEVVLALDLAVLDRHAPGVMLARTDLTAAWRWARTLTPNVCVREDIVAGEALLVLRRSRARTLSRLLPGDNDAIDRARVLLAAGEAAAAQGEIADATTPEARLVLGEAALGLRQLDEAERHLTALQQTALGPQAGVHLAAVYWLSGRRDAAEALLEELATTHDDARFHLVELLVARRDIGRATTVASGIEDAWTRREAQALVRGRG